MLKQGECGTPVCFAMQQERYEAQQKTNESLWKKTNNTTRLLWLISGGIVFANALLTYVAAYIGHLK
jgi:hypothetical protein